MDQISRGPHADLVGIVEVENGAVVQWDRQLVPDILAGSDAGMNSVATVIARHGSTPNQPVGGSSTLRSRSWKKRKLRVPASELVFYFATGWS